MRLPAGNYVGVAVLIATYYWWLITFFFPIILPTIAASKSCCNCCKSIISFGDSYADTGNSLYANFTNTHDQYVASNFTPYGETYFAHPTGRWSNGRLVIDFIAQALGLPLLKPSLANLSVDEYSGGINFAVGGATAQTASFYSNKNISIATNDSLDVQTQWFLKLLPSLCYTKAACVELFQTTLIVVGEFGGNDYYDGIKAGLTPSEIPSYVPDVVAAIANATKVLIENGASELVVANLLPPGCLPVYLTILQSTNTSDYDELGCIRSMNNIALYHNSLLEDKIKMLRNQYPHANIIYADYYAASLPIYKNAKLFGFDSSLSACCGRGGSYNYSTVSTDFCSVPGVPVCTDPSIYVNWDGIHLTEKAYELLASSIVNGHYYTKPDLQLEISHKH